ncbi:MAG TPA: hypothetical protein VE130_04545 [Nitrososphaeraceae archaeon]|nr:hypothetical protein [Nitrososphaeraceae archaeon]
MSERIAGDRDIELENIIGNLMIAEYQVDKLQSRLSERVGGLGSGSNRKSSSFVFKKNDKWYRVRLYVEEMSNVRMEKDSE